MKSLLIQSHSSHFNKFSNPSLGWNPEPHTRQAFHPELFLLVPQLTHTASPFVKIWYRKQKGISLSKKVIKTLLSLPTMYYKNLKWHIVTDCRGQYGNPVCNPGTQEIGRDRIASSLRPVWAA